MLKRCRNPKATGYSSYGARGIQIAPEWLEFGRFWNDMGPTWAPGLSIERIDNDGNYQASNCRWATVLEQAQNKRNSKIIDTPWGELTQAAAARRAGISLGSLIHRMKAGWQKETWFLPPSRAPIATKRTA